MIRILIFLLTAIFFALMITGLLGMDDHITGSAFGANFEIQSGLAIGLFVALAVILVAGTVVIKDLIQMPARMRARESAAKRDRGIAALARGLEAVAVGDGTGAQHYARIASRNLNDMALTRLLTAQASQLAGDDAAADAAFSKMVEAPETEFLGLRGLFGKAMREGDLDAARGFAERAFKLRSNARWAFDAVFDLAINRGTWTEARDALDVARRNTLISAEKAVRGEAALLTAAAYAAASSGDDELARQDADAALKSAPSFAPAAVLSARLHAERGQAHKAMKILENAFAIAPEPAIVAAHLNLFKDGSDEARAEKLERLAARNPGAPPAIAARAKALLLKGAASQAMEQLEELLQIRATAGDCALMAEATSAVYGAHAAQPWLMRAASAPRDPSLGADGEFALTRNGWSRLIREYTEYGRLVPPPLEGPPRGLAEQEFRLLAAPAAPALDLVEATEASQPPHGPAQEQPQDVVETKENNGEAPQDEPSADQEDDARNSNAAAAARDIS